jgi:hypothetical protein
MGMTKKVVQWSLAMADKVEKPDQGQPAGDSGAADQASRSFSEEVNTKSLPLTSSENREKSESNSTKLADEKLVGNVTLSASDDQSTRGLKNGAGGAAADLNSGDKQAANKDELKKILNDDFEIFNNFNDRFTFDAKAKPAELPAAAAPQANTELTAKPGSEPPPLSINTDSSAAQKSAIDSTTIAPVDGNVPPTTDATARPADNSSPGPTDTKNKADEESLDSKMLDIALQTPALLNLSEFPDPRKFLSDTIDTAHKIATSNTTDAAKLFSDAANNFAIDHPNLSAAIFTNAIGLALNKDANGKDFRVEDDNGHAELFDSRAISSDNKFGVIADVFIGNADRDDSRNKIASNTAGKFIDLVKDDKLSPDELKTKVNELLGSASKKAFDLESPGTDPTKAMRLLKAELNAELVRRGFEISDGNEPTSVVNRNNKQILQLNNLDLRKRT